jgi:hypothetical protein
VVRQENLARRGNEGGVQGIGRGMERGSGKKKTGEGDPGSHEWIWKGIEETVRKGDWGSALCRTLTMAGMCAPIVESLPISARNYGNHRAPATPLSLEMAVMR